MKVSSSLPAATNWIKFHQVPFFLGLSLVIVCAIAAAYYVSPTLQSFRTATKNNEQVPSTVLIPVQSDTSITTTSVEPISSSNSVPAVTTRVRINGQPVDVPQTGTVQKVIKNDNGNTSVNFSVKADSSGGTNASSSTNIQLDSTTRVDSHMESSQ